MNIKLFSGQYEIINSSTVMLFDKDSNLIFEIDTGDFKFTVELLFVGDGQGNKIINRTIDTEKNKITLACNNFTNVFGTNTSIPVSIATINGKGMFLHLDVSLMEDGIRIVNYTIFLERKDNI
ncbi:MAG TPA: hypothetical protein GXX75_09100 [Clostridiales bacterium]|nr:hypothetical protein [Clostridiales bacterium]